MKITSMKYLILFSFLLCLGCANSGSETDPISDASTAEPSGPKGGLFIIGGGERPEAMIRRMVQLSGVDSSGYVIVLPMASIEPDSAFWYINRQLEPLCYQKPVCWGVDSLRSPSNSQLDSLSKASLIFITGGDQNRFMRRIKGTATSIALRDAYEQGAIIAGTSAGAALMSAQMISGDQMKEEEYRSTYARVETDNALYAEGLSLLPNVIVDQHFIARSRYNRLLTALYEFPGYVGLGVDEATAAYVHNDSLEVIGSGQVVILYQDEASSSVLDSKIGFKNIRLDLLLPGDKIKFQ